MLYGAVQYLLVGGGNILSLVVLVPSGGQIPLGMLKSSVYYFISQCSNIYF